MNLEVPRVVAPATFRDHCVIDPRWLALASAEGAPTQLFAWHPKVQVALTLVSKNEIHLDRFASLPRGVRGIDLAVDASAYKTSFFEASDVLKRVLEIAASSYPLLLAEMRNVSAQVRSRALHTYAAASSLRLIRILQRFEGFLYAEDDRLILRLFPDLPNLRKQIGPMIGLPYLHPVNTLAYGPEAASGFLVARICEKNEDRYQKLTLPRSAAEAAQEQRPGPEQLFFGWIVPQWLLFREQVLPEASSWWISELSDETGQRRFSRSNESPWSGPSARTLPLPDQFEDWPASLFEVREVAPSLTAWTRQQPATAPSASAQGPAQPSTSPAPISARHSRVLCFAAAQVEFAALLESFNVDFGTGQPVSIDNGNYHAVEFVDPQNTGRWYIVALSHHGQVESAIKVARLVPLVQPDITLMVGMCMGMPSRKLPVGTVIVPNEVWSFDHQRVTGRGTEYRPHGSQEDNSLYAIARIVASEKLGYRLVVDKALATSNAKVENMASELVKNIEDSFPDAAAYDMEGWGFYRGVGGPRCLWIKAVADSGEAQGTGHEEKTRKNSIQGTATANAIHFALLLVRKAVQVIPIA